MESILPEAIGAIGKISEGLTVVVVLIFLWYMRGRDRDYNSVMSKHLEEDVKAKEKVADALSEIAKQITCFNNMAGLIQDTIEKNTEAYRSLHEQQMRVEKYLMKIDK